MGEQLKVLVTNLDDQAEALLNQSKFTNSTDITIFELGEFLNQKIPPRELLLEPWLPRQGLAMVHAYRGVGKTFFALSVAYAVASGGSFLGWKAARPARVLYLDGEMPAYALQDRLARITRSSDSVPPTGFFNVMTPDQQALSHAPFNLANDLDQAALESHLAGIELIVVDNISTLARTGKTNEAESWLPIQEWALRQRAQGRSVLFVHHSGKNGAQRGTSAKEDVVDTVIGLRHPSDYEASQGARFEVHFEKARGFSGTDAEPLEVSLVADESDQIAWHAKPMEDAIYERIIELHKEKLNQGEIAVEVKRDKSRVSRMLKRAREEGRIT